MLPETANQQKSSIFSISGLIGGLIFGGLAIGAYYIKLSAAELNSTPILPLVFVWLGCGVIGGFLGEKIVTKIGDWLSHFA